MKKILKYLALFFFPIVGNTQIVNKIIKESIDSGIIDMGSLADIKITENIKVVGLGDVAYVTKEPTKFNTTFAAYLITQKGFTSLTLIEDNSRLIPLNDMLENDVPFDNTKLDSIYHVCFDNTLYSESNELKAFIYWLKKYNFYHQKIIHFIGIGTDKIFPPSYFLTKYIYPLNKDKSMQLSLKWANKNNTDSLAFEDIKLWREELYKDLNNKNEEYKKLLNEYDNDIEHNNIVNKLKFLARTNIPNYWQEFMLSLGNEFIKKIKEKTIFYALNHFVAKSNFFVDKQSIVSIGKLLENNYHDDYYVSMTDFSDTSYLYVRKLDKNQWKWGTVAFPGNTFLMNCDKELFSYPKDKIRLKGYIPRSIHIITIPQINFPTNNEESPFDMLVNLGKINSSVSGN